MAAEDIFVQALRLRCIVANC